MKQDILVVVHACSTVHVIFLTITSETYFKETCQAICLTVVAPQSLGDAGVHVCEPSYPIHPHRPPDTTTGINPAEL